MKLVNEWTRVVRKAWSVRLAVLSALFSAAEVGTQLMATAKPTPYWAAAAAVAALAATLARLVYQPRLHDE